MLISVPSIITSAVIRRRYSPQEVPWRGIHNAIAAAMSICVAVGNKVVDTRDWHISGVCHPSMTFLLSLSFLPPHPTGCGRRESITSLRMQCQCALPRATRSWILGIGTSRGVCHPSMTFLSSLSFLPPHPTGCGRRGIHKAIAVAMSNALPRATRSWILQSASACKTA